MFKKLQNILNLLSVSTFLTPHHLMSETSNAKLQTTSLLILTWHFKSLTGISTTWWPSYDTNTSVVHVHFIWTHFPFSNFPEIWKRLYLCKARLLNTTANILTFPSQKCIFNECFTFTVGNVKVIAHICAVCKEKWATPAFNIGMWTLPKDYFLSRL